jgi:putative transposase
MHRKEADNVRDMKDMPYVMGVKIRIYPSYKQKEIISKNDGASRFLYNRLVARDRELYALRKVTVYCEPVAQRIDYLESLGTKPSDLKAAYPFLEEDGMDAQMIANAVKNYKTAWKNARTVKGAGIPTFHNKKGYEKCYQTNAHYPKDAKGPSDGNVHLSGKGHITLPILGRIRYKDSGRLQNIFSRRCESRIGSICISMDSTGDYYASLQVGSVEPFHEALPKTGTSLGIDVNIENFYTDSCGNVIENPKFRKDAAAKLAKGQRKLSRMARHAKKDGRSLRSSKNYRKQRLKVAGLHKTVSGRREAFQDVISKRLVESQDQIFAEDIRTKNLLKNHHLAAAIADCAWSSFLHKLDYKAALYGKQFRKVPAKNTTQECSVCGYILQGNEKLTLMDREWVCPSCGTHHLRDHNAAKNIETRGVGLLESPA